MSRYDDEHDEHAAHLPQPSVWPAVVGAGVSIAAFGVATSFAFCGLGAILFVWGLSGWIGELRRGHGA
jgi:hypothetical protein